MMRNMSEWIGNTPLLQLSRYGEKQGLQGVLFGKLEGANPTGSVKDRAAYWMLRGAMDAGKLRPGAVIIEPTSGNTGVGLAAIGAAMGFSVVLTMPESMSMERRMLLKAYGAKLVLTSAAEGMKGAIAKAKALLEETPGSFGPSQFDNPDNPKSHFEGTGPEIWRDTEGCVDVLVSGVGTGGTITGAGRYLRMQNPNIKIVAVEPTASPVLSGGNPGPHKIQGIGAGFVPSVLDRSLVDEVITVSDEDAFANARLLAQCEGVLCGVSSGAALWAASQILRRPQYAKANVVAILPDNGDRYLSFGLFDGE